MKAPAKEGVHYINKFLAHDPDSAIYMSKPGPELDDAWHKLLEGKASVALEFRFRSKPDVLQER